METAREHPTGRLWMDSLIKPKLLTLMFLRREWNGDFLLQQHCLKGMLPYFSATSYHNYAHYLSWNVQLMEHLPQHAKEDQLAGDWHACLSISRSGEERELEV